MNMIRFSAPEIVKFGKGILADRRNDVYQNLFRKIDTADEIRSFIPQDSTWWAEPEFSSKFVDIALAFYRASRDAGDLERARQVVEGMLRYQRQDGYLGTYPEGEEFGIGFSVWNQSFSLLGLIAYWDETGDERALKAAMRCADYIISGYQGPDSHILLRALNMGSENCCVLLEIVYLYQRTGEKRYLDFADYIVNTMENTSNGVLDIQSPTACFSIKGIEMLIIYMGLIAYGKVTNRQDCLDAAKKYWQDLYEGQIDLSGCGTVSEFWTFAGARSAMRSRDLNPNETCVAAGWIEFSVMLFEATGDIRYFDAVERTIYNHLLGAMANDGSDFAYYQGNYGRKEERTHPGQYKCCRYRAMTVMSKLPSFTCYARDDRLVCPLYLPYQADYMIGGKPVHIQMTTDYPKNGSVVIDLASDTLDSISVELRIPDSCDSAVVNGRTAKKGSFIVDVSLQNGRGRIEAMLNFSPVYHEAVVDDLPSQAVTCGPVLLAIDSGWGTPIFSTEMNHAAELERVQDYPGLLMAYECDGTVRGEKRRIRLVDYASAAKRNAQRDRFRVWIPETGTLNESVY